MIFTIWVLNDLKVLHKPVTGLSFIDCLNGYVKDIHPHSVFIALLTIIRGRHCYTSWKKKWTLSMFSKIFSNHLTRMKVT